MPTQKLEKSKWRAFFDRATKVLIGKSAEIEVASLALGDQVEAEWIPLLGIVYDPKNDVIEIALHDLDHLIQKPKELYIDIGPSGLMSLEVIDTDDVKHIIKLRDPLMLPPPSTARQKATAGEQR
jgi:hypothetical protein